MELIKVLLTLEVDVETGETKCIDRQIINDDLPPKKTTKSKKVAKDTDPTPKIILGDNKYSINDAAVELLGIKPDDRLDIKFKKIEKKLTPIIGTDEAFKTKGGNRVTKSFTVSCRGKANEMLAKFGDVFTLEPFEDGQFIMVGNAEPEVEVEDENVQVKDEELPVDLNLGGDMIEPVDDSINEISAFDFKL